MDTLKNQKKIRVSPKLQQEFKTHVLNYFNAKPEQRDTKREALQKYILKRKNTNSPLDVNAHMGFEIKLEKGAFSTLMPIVSLFDDAKLFEFLREQGLQEQNSTEMPLWYLFTYTHKNNCLAKLLSKCDFDKFFVNHSWTPLHVSITFNNMVAFDLFCNHPRFNEKYLEYLDVVNKVNSLNHATLHFNTKAIQKLLDLKAPVKNPDSILAPVDFALHKYFEVYAQGCFSTFMRKKAGLSAVSISKDVKLPAHVAKSKRDIIDTFYMLYSRVPFEYNIYSILPVQVENIPSKKWHLFKSIEEFDSVLKIRPEMLKLLLDILLSMGPGLYFSELSPVLQKLYSPMPPQAELVMPVVQGNGQISYLYTFKEVDSYFSKNIKSIQQISALYQYAKNRLNASLPGNKTANDCLKNLYELISENLGFESLEEKIVKNIVEEEISQSPVEELSTLIKKLTASDSEQGFEATIEFQLNVMRELKRKIRNEEYFVNCQEDTDRFSLGVKKNVDITPGIFSALIKVNELYRGAKRNILLQNQEKFLLKSTDFFCDFLSKIDFFVMNWLYLDIIAEQKSNESIIETISNLTIALNALGKKNKYIDYEKYSLVLLRSHCFLNIALIMFYYKTDQLVLAAQQFKELMLIFEAAGEKKLFSTTSDSFIHHVFITSLFSEIIQFASENLMVSELSEALFQLFQYRGKLPLPDKSFKYAIQCINLCIEKEQFEDAEELLTLSKNQRIYEHNRDVTDVFNEYNYAVQKYLNKMYQLVLDKSESNFDEFVEIDANQRMLTVNFNQVPLSPSYIKKYLPEGFLLNKKMIIINQIHFYTLEEIKILFESVERIIQFAQRKAQNVEAELTTKLAQLSLSTQNEEQDEYLHREAYIIMYNYQQQNCVNKKRRIKMKPQQQNENIHESTQPILQLKILKEQFNRTELKHFAKIGNEYSDLIMITDGCVLKDNLRFLAIKTEPHFKFFINACHQFENGKNEFAVSSMNPYGNDEHGVKLYDNKDIKHDKKILTKYNQQKYVLKIKGSGADRAIGIGKEYEYKGKKIIIYLVDEILTHKKADRLFKAIPK